MTNWALIYNGEKIAAPLSDEQKEDLQGEITAIVSNGYGWLEVAFGRPEATYADVLITPGVAIYFAPESEPAPPRLPSRIR